MDFPRLIALAVFLLAHSYGSSALEQVEVVGSRLGLPPALTTAQISVIEHEQIEALNKDSVVQLLQTLPGVSINRQGGAGGVTSLYVRGGEANFTVVMIDGVQVNNPTNTRGGSFDFSTLDVAAIERIELVRGPQSAIYGGDSLSGVLNIVTRKVPYDGAEVRAEVGSDEYYRLSVNASASLGEWGEADFSTGTSDSGNVVAGSDHELDYVNGAVRWASGDKFSAEAALRFSSTERQSFPEDSGGPELAIYAERDQVNTDDFAGQLKVRAKLNSHWDSSLVAQWFETDTQESSPGIFPGSEVPPSSSDIDFSRAQLIWSNQYTGDRWQLAGGFDYRDERGDSSGYLDFFGSLLPTSFDLDRDTKAVFGEFSRSFGANLSLSAGFRYDDVEELSGEWSPKAGLRYQFPNSESALRASWGRGFKPPSFFALAHPLVGNPDLVPEEAESWDIGIDHHFGPELEVSLALFDVRYKNLIDFDDTLFLNVNRDQVDSRGVESSARWTPIDPLTLRAQFTYNDLEVVDSDESLRGRPKWSAGLTGFLQVTPSLTFGLDYYWNDSVTEASRHSGESIDYVLDDYHLVDMTVSWKATKRARLDLSLHNLFDTDYYQAVGFPAAGFFPRLSATLQL